LVKIGLLYHIGTIEGIGSESDYIMKTSAVSKYISSNLAGYVSGNLLYSYQVCFKSVHYSV